MLRTANQQIDGLQGEIHRHHSHVERLLAKVVHLEQYLSEESESRTRVEQFETTVRALEEECATWRERSKRQHESWQRHFRDLALLVEADLDLDADSDEDALMRQLHDRLTERLTSLTSAHERERLRFEEQLARQREQLDKQLQQLTEGQEILIEREAELDRARDDLRKLWNDLDRAKREQPPSDTSGEVDELQVSLADVESQRDDLQSEVELLLEDCQRLANEREQLNSANEQALEQSLQQQELERQLAEKRSELEEQRQQLQGEAAELDSSNDVEPSDEGAEALQQERVQLAQEQEQLRLEKDVVRERQERLDESFHELAEQRRTLEKEREEWHNVRGQIEEKLEEHIDILGAPVFSSIDRDFVAADEPQEEYQEPEEVEFVTPDDASPADTSDLRNLLPDEDDLPESDPQHRDLRQAAGTATGDSDQDDQMISDYMQRLLNRDGGHGQNSQPSLTIDAKDVAGRQSHYRTADGMGDDELHNESAKDKEYAPRVRAPELDLSVMRDIANESARSAINRYSFKVWLHAAVVRWSVSFVAFFTGVILLYWAKNFSTIAGFSGLAALVVSLYWLLQGLWLTRFAWRSRIRYHQKSAPVVKKTNIKPVEEPVAGQDSDDQ